MSICFHHSFFLFFWTSVLTPEYVLTTEDLELGITDEREQAAFVFLGLGLFSSHDLPYFHPYTCQFQCFLTSG